MADEEKKTSASKSESKKSKADKSDKNTKKPRKNPFKSMVSFFKSVKSEGKKVIWPKGKEVLKNTVTVLVVVTIVGICIYGVDSLLSLGMKGIKNLADNTTTSTTQQTTAATTADTLAQSTTADTTAAAE